MEPDVVVVRDAGGLGDMIRLFAVVDALAATRKVAWCVDAVYTDAVQMCPSVADRRVEIVPWEVSGCRSSLGPLAKRWGDLKVVPYATGGFHPDSPVIDLFCPALKHEVATHGRPRMSRLDLWSQAAGVTLADGCVKVVVEKDKASAKWRRGIGKKPVAAIAPSSNASIRTWRNGPSSEGRVGRIGGLVSELKARGWGVVCFGSEPMGVPSEQSVHADIRVQAARLARCEVFVGPDSGMLHLACALGMPAVGIFGPTDSRLVLHRYDNPRWAISGRWGPEIWRRVGCDRPCYGIPRGGYNHTTCAGRCLVMEQITERMVADAVENLMKPLGSLRQPHSI